MLAIFTEARQRQVLQQASEEARRERFSRITGAEAIARNAVSCCSTSVTTELGDVLFLAQCLVTLLQFFTNLPALLGLALAAQAVGAVRL